MIVDELVTRFTLTDNYSREADRITGATGRSATAIDLKSRALGVAGNVMRRAGQAALGLSAAMLAIGVTSVRAYNQYEASLNKIVGLVGVARGEVEGFDQAIRRMTSEVGRGPQELAEAMFFVTSAGMRGRAAMDVLTISAKAATAGLGETASIADAVTSAVNAYGEANLSATRATDVLVAAVREGKLEASQLAPVLGKLLPMSSAMGVSFEQVAGALAVMSRTGLNAAEASTSLGAVLQTLLKPGAEAEKILGEAGLSMSSLKEMAAGPGGLIRVMRTLEEAFRGNDDALSRVVPNVQAFRGVMNILAQDGRIVDSVMQGVANSAGATEAAFAVASQGGAVKMQNALNAMSSAALDLGESLAPAATSLAQMVSFASEMGIIKDTMGAISDALGLDALNNAYAMEEAVINIAAGVMAIAQWWNEFTEGAKQFFGYLKAIGDFFGEIGGGDLRERDAEGKLSDGTETGSRYERARKELLFLAESRKKIRDNRQAKEEAENALISSTGAVVPQVQDAPLAPDPAISQRQAIIDAYNANTSAIERNTQAQERLIDLQRGVFGGGTFLEAAASEVAVSRRGGRRGDKIDQVAQLLREIVADQGGMSVAARRIKAAGAA
jgi:hypothetical protein